ncbi:MAG: tetratricopeptide repeat protein [Fimbriimonadaceae bacterium]
MVTCRHCETANGLDARFCKNCGAEIEKDRIDEARAEVDRLVSEGFRLFQEGRVEEARLVAEKTTEDDPTSINALTLMGMCLEREGDLVEALKCYERIAERNPDSALDKIKVTQLRNKITAVAVGEEQSARKRAYIGAAAAFVLVAGLGAAVAGIAGLSRSGGDPVARVGTPAQIETAGPAAFPGSAATDPPNQTAPPAEAPAETGPGRADGPQPGPDDVAPLGQAVQVPRPNTVRPMGNIRPLPAPTGPIPPMIPPAPTGWGTIQTSPMGGQESPPSNPVAGQPAPRPADDVDPVIVGPGTVASGSNRPTAPAQDDGLIEINVRRGERPLGGSQPIPDPDRAESYLRSARQSFLLGEFDRAARSYEQALRAGADPATVNQRLGQVYANMNRREDAIRAYERAISSFEASLRSGTGDRARIESSLEAARQAVRNLRGQ